MFIHISIVIIPFLLLMAAMFAAAEASLFSLTQMQLETLRESRPQLHRVIRGLLSAPEKLLSTLIIGNEFINILLGTLVTALLEFHLEFLGETAKILLAAFVSSVLLLAFSEVLPKVLAFRLPVLVSSFAAYPASVAQVILAPLRHMLIKVSGKIIQKLSLEAPPATALSEQDFLTMVEVGAESGSLGSEEKEMIFNVFKFSDRSVSEVMTPWNKVFSIREDSTFDQVVGQVTKHQYSRIPVMAADGTVVGILYAKELLKRLLNPGKKEREGFESTIFPPYIVSTHNKVAKLFREFKLKKVHLALVVDEYGRQLGIVTLEDLLNALFASGQKREGDAR